MPVRASWIVVSRLLCRIGLSKGVFIQVGKFQEHFSGRKKTRKFLLGLDIKSKNYPDLRSDSVVSAFFPIYNLSGLFPNLRESWPGHPRFLCPFLQLFSERYWIILRVNRQAICYATFQTFLVKTCRSLSIIRQEKNSIIRLKLETWAVLPALTDIMDW